MEMFTCSRIDTTQRISIYRGELAFAVKIVKNILSREFTEIPFSAYSLDNVDCIVIPIKKSINVHYIILKCSTDGF